MMMLDKGRIPPLRTRRYVDSPIVCHSLDGLYLALELRVLSTTSKNDEKQIGKSYWSAVARKRELKHEPTTDKISLQCTDHLFDKIHRSFFTMVGSKMKLCSQKMGWLLVSWIALKTDDLWDRPVLGLMHEASFFWGHEARHILAINEKQLSHNPAYHINKFIPK